MPTKDTRQGMIKEAYAGVRHVIDIFMSPEELREVADHFEAVMKDKQVGDDLPSVPIPSKIGYDVRIVYGQ